MRKLFLGFFMIMMTALTVQPVYAQGTVLDVAAGNEDFSTLVAAVEAADPSVAELLSNPGNYTVLAPTNTAFLNLASYLGVELEELLLQPQVLTDLLLYHVIDGEIFSSQIATQYDGAVVPTLLEGAFVNFDVQEDTGQLVVNEVVEIVQTDIDAGNGVIHVLNDVLLNRIINERIDATDFSVPAIEAETAEGANIRVAHTSPDAPAVDVYINGDAAITDLEFGSVTDFVTLPAGTYSIAVVPAGDSLNNAVIGPADFALPEGAFVTVAAVGSVEAGTLDVAVLEDSITPAEDAARILVLHSIEDAPAVDVLAGSDVIINGLAYPQFETIDVAPGSYDLTVTISGDADTALLDASDVTIEAGSYLFIAAIGTADTPGLLTDVTTVDDLSNLVALMETGGTNEIDDVIAGQDRFQALLDTANAADPAVLDTLGQTGPFTLFAPTNDALIGLLADLGASSPAALDPAILTQILLYHVVEGAVTAEAVAGLDGESVETLLDDQFVAISVSDDGVVLNGLVNVIETDISANNGVIHIIDTVLLPQPVIDALGN